MASLFTISSQLEELFNEIEENEGILTPELEEQLLITQEDFKYKVQDYANAIKMLEGNIEAIKKEKLRLQTLQQSKEKTIERLKEAMKVAIIHFGDTNNKTGSKYIDFGTGSISLRKSQSLEIDEASIDRFVKRALISLQWNKSSNLLFASEINYDDIVDYANQKSQAEIEEDAEVVPFTKDDIKKLKTKLSFDVNLEDMLTTEDGIEFVRHLINYIDKIDTKVSVDKTDIKSQIKNGETCPTYAKLVSKNNVVIK